MVVKNHLNTLVFIVLIQFAYLSAKLYYIEVKYPLLRPLSSETNIPNISLWPMPQFVNDTSKGFSVLRKDYFKITSNIKCDIMDENIRHYTNILFPPRFKLTGNSASDVLLSELSIEIANTECPKYPNSALDESYDLNVMSGLAKLKTNTIWGALKGLETFSQLTDISEDKKLIIKDSVHIKDTPRFTYRGLLVDTGRHFIPVPVLKKQIDAMSYTKFNVLHWHIVDDQSFALEMLKHPSLTTKGRYTPASVYTRKDVKDILEHARLRGIRVIPEFDTPGHTESFGRTFPQFITVCWNNGLPYQAIYSVQGEAEILNPTMEGLYPVLKDILSEYKDAFVDEYIHLGMDEVYYECWKSNPNISQWMQQMNFTDYHQLEGYYSSKMLQIAKDLNKKVTVWQDVWDNGVKLEMDTQIQIWKDTTTLPYHRKWYEYLNDITKDGYKAILSSPWYINFVSYGYLEWFKWYEIEPMANFTGTAEQAKLLIGGEACLWSEYVDGGNIDSRLWPRASVIAERLWSPASINNPEEAKFRLDEHRCRLLRRGVQAAPVLNGFCGDYEYGMENSVIFDKEFNYGWPVLTSGSSESTQRNYAALCMALVGAFFLIALGY